jgi:hypothetical protein
MYRTCLLIAGAFVLWGVKMSSAQESKLYTPQPEHELLKRFEGEWRFEKLSVAADGSTPAKLGSGEIKAELLGGFFVVVAEMLQEDKWITFMTTQLTRKATTPTTDHGARD